MKVQKLITIDSDVAERLKNVGNASGMINTLLRRHFGELIGSEECQHIWSNAFSTPGGLMRECNICHKTEFLKVQKDAK